MGFAVALAVATFLTRQRMLFAARNCKQSEAQEKTKSLFHKARQANGLPRGCQLSFVANRTRPVFVLV